MHVRNLKQALNQGLILKELHIISNLGKKITDHDDSNKLIST